MSLETEKQAFKDILSTKPTWAPLLDSEFVELLTGYMANRSEAQMFEAERIHQERYMPLALDRESIMARAEDEGYIPNLPVPFQMYVAITNKHEANAVYLTYRQPLLSNDGIPLVLDESVSLMPLETRNVPVSQLSCENKTFQSKGEVYEEIIIGGKDDDDVFTLVEFTVVVDGVEWSNRQRFRNALDSSEVYHKFYRVTDEMAIRFGNNDTGKGLQTGQTVSVTIWNTKGERAFIVPDQEMNFSGTVYDVTGAEADLEVVSASLIRRGQAIEEAESVRRSVLSHIQQGSVTARNSDYEYMIARSFPELCFLKVWGEKEQTEETGYSIDNINKSFFTFLVKDEATTLEIKDKIVSLYDDLLKPMNVQPYYKTLEKVTFQILVEGRVDRVYDKSFVQGEVEKLLFKKYGIYKNQQGKLNVSDIYEILSSSGYFRDAQPHLNRKNRPFYRITVSGITETNKLSQYVFLDQITFQDGNGAIDLGYTLNV